MAISGVTGAAASFIPGIGIAMTAAVLGEATLNSGLAMTSNLVSDLILHPEMDKEDILADLKSTGLSALLVSIPLGFARYTIGEKLAQALERARNRAAYDRLGASPYYDQSMGIGYAAFSKTPSDIKLALYKESKILLLIAQIQSGLFDLSGDIAFDPLMNALAQEIIRLLPKKGEDK